MLIIGNYYVNYQNYQNLIQTNVDASILVYKFRPESGFNMFSE